MPNAPVSSIEIMVFSLRQMPDARLYLWKYLALATRVSLLPSAERLITITSKYIDPAKFLLILIVVIVMLTLIDKVDKEEKGAW